MSSKLAVIALAFGLPGAALAQGGTGAGETPLAFREMIACRVITDRDQRLACFDAKVAVLDEAAEQRQIVVVDREAIRETRRTLFGLAIPDLNIFRSEDEEGAPSEIQSEVSGVRELNFDRYELTLKDGSVWQITEGVRGFFPRVGQPVHIRKTALSSYTARIGSRPGVRVRRVR